MSISFEDFNDIDAINHQKQKYCVLQTDLKPVNAYIF